ncbi:MBL fold metallo-hydrolase [Fibrobacter sp.]|uniref:MBL fold metallo-hydrolase n=1 Tax=Fibrobacter sp. TaxID=35828 RepID=UPI00388DD456
MGLKKNFVFIATTATAIALAGCSSSQEKAKNEGAAPAAEQATAEATATTNTAATQAEESSDFKTINLENGATLTWIKDNKGERLMPRDLFSDASDSLFASLNLPDGIPASVSTFLLKADGEYVLFDAGLGSFGGETAMHLDKLGVPADSIKKIYITHMHVDHVAGLVSGMQEGNPQKVFKNAEIYLAKVEHDAWLNLPKNDLQKAVIELYKDKLHLFEFGETLPHNISVLDAIGHTPGHTVFQVEGVLVIGDLMHGYALQKDHPEINSNYDMDKEKSAESRKRLMDLAKQNSFTLAGMHLPAPGFVK